MTWKKQPPDCNRVKADSAMARPLVPALLALTLCSCAAPQSPGIRLALEGPPLAVAMRGETTAWSGFMDRGCMAGVGNITLHGAEGVTCTGDMDHPATDKGRLYADLACTDGGTLALVFRNLGPDQGMGLARRNPEAEDGEPVTLFFHPSREEAERRLAEVRQEIADALRAQQKSVDEAE